MARVQYAFGNRLKKVTKTNDSDLKGLDQKIEASKPINGESVKRVVVSKRQNGHKIKMNRQIVERKGQNIEEGETLKAFESIDCKKE